jgi:F-type H+-transporting ATPase subunit gamma
MANARAIVKRRKAVVNIKKITKTMQLIATAKYQKCLGRATASQPYTEKLTELVTRLSGQVKNVKHPLLEVNEGTGRTAVLVLTSNRGLCGSFNAQALRKAVEHVGTVPEGTQVDLDAVGKKGIAYFKFLGYDLHETYSHFDDNIRFDEVEQLANGYIEQYTQKKIDAVHVVYMKFESTSRQRPVVAQLLPLQSSAASDGSAAGGSETQYDFSPEPAELLAELLPASVRIRLFQFFSDSTVSEQIARMVAMKAATDAAGDMIKILTRTYNRARQTQITMELLDILGGVEALK